MKDAVENCLRMLEHFVALAADPGEVGVVHAAHARRTG